MTPHDYVLTQDDLLLASHLARTRNDPKEHYANPKWFDGKPATLTAHEVGIRGEIAVANVLGLPVDQRVLPQGRQTDVCMTMPSGLTVAVRSRTQRGWDFALNSTFLMTADVGVLTWPGPLKDSVSLVGWATKVRIALKATIQNFGYGERLVLSYMDLLPMTTLLELAGRAPSQRTWSVNWA